MVLSTLKCRVIQILEQPGLPKLDEASFTKCHRPVAHGQGRSRLVSGSLKMGDGQSFDVVVKVLSASYAYKTKNADDVEEYIRKLLAYFEREVDIWQRASEHCNVVRLMGFMSSFENEMFPALVMPKYTLGCLRTVVSRSMGILGECDKLTLLRDVARGLAYLHSINIVHRDIKGSNILVAYDQSIVARINDFGSAKLLHPTLNTITKSTQTNSLAWSPPEYLDSEVRCCSYSKPTPAGDMWSFGCLFLEVFTGADPWKRSTDIEEQLENNRHPPIPSDVVLPSRYVEFLLMCWDVHPENRVTSERAVELLDYFIELLP